MPEVRKALKLDLSGVVDKDLENLHLAADKMAPFEMDDVELAKLFIRYRETSDALKALEFSVEEQVLLRGETVKIAGVTASYSKLSYSYDYEQAARVAGADQKMIDAHSTPVPASTSVCWKEIAEELEVDMKEYGTPKPAHVTVKV